MSAPSEDLISISFCCLFCCFCLFVCQEEWFRWWQRNGLCCYAWLYCCLRFDRSFLGFLCVFFLVSGLTEKWFMPLSLVNIVDHYCLIFDRGKVFVLLLVILSTINASLLIFKVGIKTNIYFLAWITTLHN